MSSVSRRNFVKLASTLPLAMAAAENVPHDIPYGVARWPAHLGNHRARVRVVEKAPAVWLHLPWRRRDYEPQRKGILILDAQTGKQIRNVATILVNREFGDIVFEPLTAPGDYHVYYMPFRANAVPWKYSVEYSGPQTAADTAWLRRVQGEPFEKLPQAVVTEIQAISEFDRFDPMEVIAARDEIRSLLTENAKQGYLLFPEFRQHPIRMARDLPLRWIRNGPSKRFRDVARRGEFYVFQIGLYAAAAKIEGLAVEYGDLRSQHGHVIPAGAIRCLNLGGFDWLGRPLTKQLGVAKGEVQALWFGVQIPENAPAGEYRGTLKLRPQGFDETLFTLSLAVSSAPLQEAGDSELWRHSRLRWLDSTLGLDDEVTAPYTPLEVEGRTVRCLGREVRFGPAGLPESIRSNGREILAAPARMVVETAQGQLPWSAVRAEMVKSTPGAVVWDAESSSTRFTCQCQVRMEFDGHLNCEVLLKAKESAKVEDLRLELPLRREIATYMMGLGRKGGYRPRAWNWVWDVERANHMVWIGDADAGLQCKLKGPDDSWEIYNLKQSGVPTSWSNEGKGGCDIIEEGDQVIVRAYSGEREFRADEELRFRFALLITPVKPLDPAHWSQRYYHRYVTPETAARVGATIINVHHGNELNPYINYPFLTVDNLSAYVNEAHAQGLKVKIYYTVRELTNHAVEIWALRSLGNEILADGEGGGGAWLQEHLISNYSPAWHHTFPTGEVDAAIVTTGLSRWHNYYLEGLAYLLRHAQIDGLYLDGIGYDRTIMKRVRKVLDRNRPGCLIDFHSGNEFTFQDLRISPANKYMEHLPFIDSLWFGEMYDYNESPDYWLVEVSGIPFGLFSEMLEKNGNPWRGMIYGMTARYYSGADPKHIWSFWDTFGIQEAEMIGYWNPSCPVKTGHENVLATVYKRPGRTLVSIASWAEEPVRCRLHIDWSFLGLSAEKVTLLAPPIPGFQEARSFRPNDEIPVEPSRGWLLVIGEQEA